VGPHSFTALGIRLRSGRDFSPDDRTGAPAVAIISAAAAKTLGGAPLGRRIALPGWGESREIVGVVEDVKYMGLDASFQPDVYVPNLQFPFPSQYLVVRSQGDVAALTPVLRRTVVELDKGLVIEDVGTMQSRVSDALSERRFAAVLLAAFAGLSLLLAGLGIYGVVAYVVAEGRHEIGIRLALGARPRDILEGAILLGVRLGGTGLAAGVLASLWLVRFVRGWLYGVGPYDPAAFAMAAAVALVVAGLASLLPARRAARVDPLVTLRHD